MAKSSKRDLFKESLLVVKDNLISEQAEEKIIEEPNSSSPLTSNSKLVSKDEILPDKKYFSEIQEVPESIKSLPENEKNKTTMVSEPLSNDQPDESLNEIVRDYLKRIEKAKEEESRKLKFQKGQRKKFDEKFPILPIPARKEFHEVIDILFQNSNLKKYELMEILLYNGLKHTNFDT